jgi:(p)ppGpp synthase/HD superfamily hydrolase
VNTNAIDKTFAIIDLEIEVNNQEHIDLLISKVNVKKFISKCERHINETE